MKAKDLTVSALLAALICALSPWTIPVGPVPITLASFVVYFTAAATGWKRGATAVVVYILLGMAGLPVFSGFAGGFQRIAGVTGGYIVGYIPCAILTGYFADRHQRLRNYVLGMLAGTAALYLLGTIWYCLTTSTAPAAALMVCVIPFLPGDAAKIVLASLLTVQIRPIADRYLTGGIKKEKGM